MTFLTVRFQLILPISLAKKQLKNAKLATIYMSVRILTTLLISMKNLTKHLLLMLISLGVLSLSSAFLAQNVAAQEANCTNIAECPTPTPVYTCVTSGGQCTTVNVACSSLGSYVWGGYGSPYCSNSTPQCCVPSTPISTPTSAPVTTLVWQQVAVCPAPTNTSAPTSIPPTSTPAILIPTPTTIPTNIPIPTFAVTVTQNSPTSTPASLPYCYLKSKGDANCDNYINIVDFQIWSTDFVNALKGIVNNQSDFNNDGVITIVDFNIWKTSRSDTTLPH